MKRENMYAVRKKTSHVLMVVLMMICIPFGFLSAADSFTVSPEYVGSDESATITVSAAANTFSDQSNPVLVKNGTSFNVTVISQADSEIKFTIPPDLENGTYEVRIGDPNGDASSAGGFTYFSAGNIEVQDPQLNSGTPLLSLPNGYDSKSDVQVDAKYAGFSSGKTKVEIIDASGNIVAKPVVTDLKNLDNYTQRLTFALDTGLDSGHYDVRIITGEKTLSIPEGIEIRGVPSVTLQNVDQLSEGYSQTEIVVNGMNTGFTSGTSVTVRKKGDDNTFSVNTEKVAGSPTIVNGEQLSFTLDSGLTAGQYQVFVKTGVEEASAVFDVKEPAVTLQEQSTGANVDTIGQSSSGTIDLQLAGNYTNFDPQTMNLRIYNSSGTEVTGAISGQPTLVGQSIHFTLNKNLATGIYTVSAFSGTKEVTDTFEVVKPSIQHVVFQTPLFDTDGNGLAYGYTSFPITVTGKNTEFTSNTTVFVEGQNGYILSLNSPDHSTLEFSLNNGLPSGSYQLVIDVDGDVNTSDDQIRSPSLAFHVLGAPVISSIDPNKIVNTYQSSVTMTVTGANTFFNADPDLKVVIKDGEGKAVTTPSNIQVNGQESLSFNIVPGTISKEGDYLVEVKVDEAGYTQTLQKKLTVETAGIASVNPGILYEDDLAGKSIELAGEGTLFTQTDSVIVGGQEVNYTPSSNSSMTIEVPSNLAAGTHNITVNAAGNVYESSFVIKEERKITGMTPSEAEYGDEGVTVTLTTQSINLKSNIPEIVISNNSGYHQKISAQSTQDSSKITFTLPSGLDDGSYKVEARWSSGEHSGLILFAGTFTVTDRYKDLYIKAGGQKVTSLVKNENDPDFTLKAFGIRTKENLPDDELTEQAEWSVVSGQNVLEIASDGTVSILKDGIATVQADYNDVSGQVTITVNNVSDQTGSGDNGSGSSDRGDSDTGGGYIPTGPSNNDDGEEEEEETGNVVKRIRTENGNTQVNVDVRNTEEIINAAENKSTLELDLTEETNEADEIVINLANDQVEEIRDEDKDLVIQTEKASIKLSKDMLNKFSKDLEIKVEKVNDEEKVKIEEAMSKDGVEAEETMKSIRIETNFSEETEITIPVEQGDDLTEEDLKKLGVYVVHSDGDREFVSGRIIYDDDGNILGIKIRTSKFSTFTVVKTAEPLPYFNWHKQYNVENDKVWNITFNIVVDEETINEETVYVEDANGKRIDVKVDMKDGKTIFVTPVKLYESGKEYNLVITDEIKGKSGKAMMETVRMPFEAE